MCGEHDIHPSVPYTQMGVTLFFCHACRAWSVYYDATQWNSDVQGSQPYKGNVKFGPFEDWEDVLEIVELALHAMVTSPGAPWVTGETDWDPGLIPSRITADVPAIWRALDLE